MLMLRYIVSIGNIDGKFSSYFVGNSTPNFALSRLVLSSLIILLFSLDSGNLNLVLEKSAASTK